jgi:hypothetical protein
MNYKPDINGKDYYTTQVDTLGTFRPFSYYDGTINGAFSRGRFGGISFGIDNNIEMKVRDKNDTTAKSMKKVRLIDGFGFNGGYNMLADSFRLSPISLYLRSTLFENINITANAILNPYQLNARGDEIDRYAWQDGKFSLGTIQNGNIAISTTFRSKEKNKEGEKDPENDPESELPQLTMDEQMAQLEYVRQNPLNVSYSLSFLRTLRPDYSGWETRINSNFNWNGDFNLTPRWKMGMNGFYDFNTSSIQSLTMFISREMHCWQLSINVTPVGLYRSFNITINPKSGLLRDLRVNRTRFFYGQ